MLIFQKSFYQKTIASVLIIAVFFLLISPILLLPRKAQAQCIVSAPGATSAIGGQTGAQTSWQAAKATWQAGNYAEFVSQAYILTKGYASQLLTWSTGVLFNLLAHQLLAMLTNDIVDWVQNGGTPRFMSMGLNDYLSQAADNAIGAFIDQYLGAGWLCEPFDIDIKIALLEVPTFEEKVRCSLSDIVDNINDFYNDFSKGGWKGWIELSKPQNNFYGALFLAQAEKESFESRAKEELAKDAEMGDGFLSPKDCIWYDKSGVMVEKQTDVWGTPPLPDKCKPDPNNPGKTKGGFIAPCYKRCQILTPASSVKRIVDEALTGAQKTYYETIGGAVAKSGPFAVYLMPIVNALFNRVIKEGLLFAGIGKTPEYGDVGASVSLPKTANPESVLQNKENAASLTGQLNLVKQNLETELLKEQKNNLAVLKLFPPIYQNEIVPILDDIILNCSDTPYTSYITWAQSQKDQINNVTVPSLNQRINQLETIDITKTITTINDDNVALVSIQNYVNKADAWLKIYELVEGRDVLELKAAEVEMNQALNQAVSDSQKVVKTINGTVTSSDIIGLSQEAQTANLNIVNSALALKEQRGDPAWPGVGTLYAELESAQGLKSEANSKLNTCLNWTSL